MVRLAPLAAAFVLAVLLMGALPSLAWAQPPTACATLAGLVDAQPGTDGAFLSSYPTAGVGPLHRVAFVYDNALAVVALIGCGDSLRARRLGDALLWAQNHDRYWHDGRLRNAYLAGPTGEGPVKLAGWWSEKDGRWLEDRYQVGSDCGNQAWAMLAFLALEDSTGERRYGDGALAIATWVAERIDRRGQGGFTGGTFGHEPTPEVLTWKSTEHNTDLAAAFSRLATRKGLDQARWRGLSQTAEAFVDAMWDETCQCFAAGTGPDGVTRNPILALDAQIWPLTALPGGADRWAGVLATVDRRLTVHGGTAYGEDRKALWTEGTGQLALLLALMGKTDAAKALNGVIAGQLAPGGGYFATDAGALPTGFMLDTDPTKPREYFHLAHLGASAWAALAERRSQPFTGTSAPPGR